jgi:2-hydroxyacyl-CoA lyase 1
VHGLAGLANAQQNCWPMILIGGASETYRGGMGAFQEERQVLIASPFCKFAHAIDTVARIPYYVEMATRNAIYGRPGATYLDFPDDMITGKVDEDKIVQVERAPDPPRTVAPQEYIEDALNLLEKAERPLVLVGKGMAWSRAEDEVRTFLERTQIPFLRSPMGKGVVPDDHPLSVAAARTLALQNADVVFLMGARFNWIFHFGQASRYAKDMKVIQLDIAPEEIGHNKATEVALEQWRHRPRHARDPGNPMFNMKPNSLIYGARYDRMMEAFGGKGFFVEDPKDLKGALAEAMNHRGPALVNVMISQGAARKPQAFRWHS